MCIPPTLAKLGETQVCQTIIARFLRLMCWGLHRLGLYYIYTLSSLSRWSGRKTIVCGYRNNYITRDEAQTQGRTTQPKPINFDVAFWLFSDFLLLFFLFKSPTNISWPEALWMCLFEYRGGFAGRVICDWCLGPVLIPLYRTVGADLW